MKFLLVIALTLSFSISAHAKVKRDHEGGGTTQGGGGGVLCDVKKYDGTVMQTLELADYYDAANGYISDYKTEDEKDKEKQFLKRGGFSGFRVENLFEGTQEQMSDKENFQFFETEQETLGFILKQLTPLPEMLFTISEYLELIGPIEQWEDKKLTEYKDHDFTTELPSNCKYVQIALRKGDSVQANKKLIALLSPSQRALLRFHEAVYYAAKERSKTENSSMVRNIVRKLIEIMFTKEFEGLAIETANNEEYFNLCKVAQSAGLCNPLSILTMYAKDVIGTNNLFSKNLVTVSKIYKNSNAAKTALHQYSKEFIEQKNQIFVFPMITQNLRKQRAHYEGANCGKITSSFMEMKGDIWSAANATGIKEVDFLRYKQRCDAILSNLSLSMTKIFYGFVKKFCAESQKGSLVCLSFKVPGLIDSEKLFSADSMDLYRLYSLVEFTRSHSSYIESNLKVPYVADEVDVRP